MTPHRRFPQCGGLRHSRAARLPHRWETVAALTAPATLARAGRRVSSDVDQIFVGCIDCRTAAVPRAVVQRVGHPERRQVVVFFQKQLPIAASWDGRRSG